MPKVHFQGKNVPRTLPQASKQHTTPLGVGKSGQVN